MRLSLNRRGSTSLTDQLKAQVRHLILSGRLGTGSRLPPVRTLAGFLRVNRKTVARADAAPQGGGGLEGPPRPRPPRGRDPPVPPRLTRPDRADRPAPDHGLGRWAGRG